MIVSDQISTLIRSPLSTRHALRFPERPVQSLVGNTAVYKTPRIMVPVFSALHLSIPNSKIEECTRYGLFNAIRETMCSSLADPAKTTTRRRRSDSVSNINSAESMFVGRRSSALTPSISGVAGCTLPSSSLPKISKNLVSFSKRTSFNA
jgi:hypothetical protein